MTIINEAAAALVQWYVPTPSGVHHAIQTSLDPAAWDVGTFLTNAKKTIDKWGNLLLKLLGVAALVWAAVLTLKKLMASQQSQSQQAGWPTIILLTLVGGGFMIGGFGLAKTIGGGGETSIRQLGGGAIDPSLLLSVFGLG